MISQQPQQPQNGPQIYVPQLSNQRQVPVRLSSVNFEGVFTSSRLNMENLISQNLYNNNAQNNPPQNVQNITQPRPNIPNTMNLAGNSKGTPQQGSNNPKK
jgi:hypothetical protein